VDLAGFSQAAFPLVTYPRRLVPEAMLPEPEPSFPHDKVRVAEIYSPYLWNAATLRRTSSAYHTAVHGGTHFVERRNYLDFRGLKNRGIQDIAAGVSAPKIRLLERLVPIASKDIWNRMEQADPDSFLRFAFVEESLPQEFASLEGEELKGGLGGVGKGAWKLTGFGPNECRLEVSCPQDCALYYSDGHDSHWRAFIDSTPAKIYSANGAFKAMALRQGRSEVRFVYKPKSYLALLALYFLTLAAAGSWMLLSRHD